MFLLSAKNGNPTKEETENLEILISRISGGDKDAFRLFYEQTKTSVYAFARSFLNNALDAEDVMQTVYLNIYRSAHLYSPSGKPMAWIITITKNLCLNKIAEKEKEIPGLSGNNHNIGHSDYVNFDNRMLAEYCLKRLNDDERKIVVLHAVSGFKHHEIAKLLEIPLGTVLSKYQRAMKKMKKYLQGGEYGDE